MYLGTHFALFLESERGVEYYGQSPYTETLIKMSVTFTVPSEFKSPRHAVGHENGQIKEEENYKDGKKDGKFTWWHENGQVHFEQNYKDGVLIK